MIVDSHVHIFPPRMIAARGELAALDATFAEMYSDPAARMATAEELVAAMDEDGVDVSVAMGIGWADPDLARESNEYIAEAAARHRGRVIGFGSVNPRRGRGGRRGRAVRRPGAARHRRAAPGTRRASNRRMRPSWRRCWMWCGRGTWR